MAITASMVKELREMTGAGMMDCKKALTATEGDMDKHNLFYLFSVQRQEHDCFIYTVQKLRSYRFFQHGHYLFLRLFNHHFAILVINLFELALNVCAAQVGSHDDNRILEVYRTSLVVSQTSVVQNLQQNIEHIGMCFFYFIK